MRLIKIIITQGVSGRLGDAESTLGDFPSRPREYRGDAKIENSLPNASEGTTRGKEQQIGIKTFVRVFAECKGLDGRNGGQPQQPSIALG